MRDGPDVRFTRAGDHWLAYATFGIGTPDVVFVSPLTSNIDILVEPPELRQMWDRFAATGRLILFDRHGSGLSDPAPGLGVGTVDEWADDLEAVLDAVDAHDVCLFALNAGAPYALVFAATHPERVRAIALIEPLVPYAGDLGGDEIIDLTAAHFERRWGEGALVPLGSPTLARDPTAAAYWARLERNSMSRGTACQAWRDFWHLDVRSAVPLVHAPTLVMFSTDISIYQSRATAARWLTRRLRHVEFIEVAHTDAQWWWHAELSGPMLDAVTAHFTGRPPSPHSDRVLATVLFTDLVGSTERAGEMGDRRWRQVLETHDAVVEQEVERYSGTFVKSTGDGILAIFDSPTRAVRCSAAIRERLGGLGLGVRAGIHTGEVERRASDVAGLAVHLAARITDLAVEGEILVSRTVPDLAVGSGLEFVDRGEHELKGVAERWQVLEFVGGP